MGMPDRLVAGRRVDRYWDENPVRTDPLENAEDALAYLEWRFEEYPLAREFAGLWGAHDGEVILDYGCGPGNDLIGFLAHTGARKVIGIDVSPAALDLARRGIAALGVPEERFELIQVSDSNPRVPLDDDSVDYLQCLGVLQHTSDPLSILRELHRVLKPGHEARVMVYNRDSVWLHLYTAYVVMVLEGRYPDLSVDQAFERTTDGPECPVARCWRHPDFLSLCGEAGFEGAYLGGFLSRHELDQLARHGEDAMGDKRLGAEHREFLAELRYDEDGYPTWRGDHAGVGGSYVLTKQ